MRYNIVVMPSSANSMRKYSFSKFTLVFLGTLFFLIIGSAIVSIAGGIIIYKQKQNVVLENEKLVNKNNQLEDYKKELDTEIKQVRKMEQKIRNVLGLEQQEEGTNPTSNGKLLQGGFDPGLPENPEEAVSGLVMNPKINDIDEDLPLLKKIQIVKKSIEDLYEFADGKEKEFVCTPSINPIQKKGAFWFSSGFGYRIHPLTGKRQFHRGQDIAARRGTEIFAPANGEISLIRWDKYLGRMLKIKHDSKYTTVYGHLMNKYADGIKKGKKVKRGDLIGYVGRTGSYTTGSHLHYEVHVNGKPQNPMRFILDLK